MFASVVDSAQQYPSEKVVSKALFSRSFASLSAFAFTSRSLRSFSSCAFLSRASRSLLPLPFLFSFPLLLLTLLTLLLLLSPLLFSLLARLLLGLCLLLLSLFLLFLRSITSFLCFPLSRNLPPSLDKRLTALYIVSSETISHDARSFTHHFVLFLHIIVIFFLAIVRGFVVIVLIASCKRIFVSSATPGCEDTFDCQILAEVEEIGYATRRLRLFIRVVLLIRVLFLFFIAVLFLVLVKMLAHIARPVLRMHWRWRGERMRGSVVVQRVRH
ncbi:hypothetical protein KC335_g109 [Hortaea werneckii]|nr:hypothetical protein KC335_g109 [Hortaea werneckii]